MLITKEVLIFVKAANFNHYKNYKEFVKYIKNIIINNE